MARNGVLSEEIEFKNGQPEGLALAYFPSGHWKARVETRLGLTLEKQF